MTSADILRELRQLQTSVRTMGKDFTVTIHNEVHNEVYNVHTSRKSRWKKLTMTRTILSPVVRGRDR